MAVQPTEETLELLKKRKTIVTIENRYGRIVDVNLDKAERMVARNEATIISKEEVKKLQKALDKKEAKVEAKAKADAETKKEAVKK